MQVAIDAPAYIVAKDVKTKRSWKPKSTRAYLAEASITFQETQTMQMMFADPTAAKLFDSELEALANAKRVGGYVLEVVAAGGRI